MGIKREKKTKCKQCKKKYLSKRRVKEGLTICLKCENKNWKNRRYDGMDYSVCGTNRLWGFNNG